MGYICDANGVPILDYQEEDAVNHPAHYTQGHIEVIDFIEDQQLGYHLGNAIKYVCRCRYKGTPRQDVEKAIWYLQRWLDKGGMADE